MTDLQSDLRKLKSKQGSGYRRVIAPALVLLTALLLWLIPATRQQIESWLAVEAVPMKKHLVVLPFTNVGEDRENQAFCDGMLETMTSKLTQLEQFHGSLWIVPATEVRQRLITSVREARRAFGVTLAVTGSVQRGSGQVRMTLNLVDAETDRQLRSSVFDDTLSRLTTIQDSTILRLVDMLEVELMPEQRRILMAGGTTAGRAYDLYLQGRGYLQRYGEAGAIDSAIVLLKRALAADLDYAGAYAALGEAYWRKYEESSDTMFVELAKTNCLRALQLDDRLRDARLTMGSIKSGTGFYDDAVRDFQLALQLDTANYDAYRGLTRTYARLNKPEEAEAALKKAISLKPDYWRGYCDLGILYLSYGRNREALPQLQKVVELLPEDYRSRNDLGALYYQLDRVDDAREAWKHSLELEPNYAAYSNLGSLYYLESRFVEAASMFEKALDLDSHSYQVWGNLATAYYWIPGKRDEARTMFQRAASMAEQQRSVNPRDPAVLSDLAAYYAKAGELSKGLPLILEALSLAPDKIDIMVDAGLFYLEVGEKDSARSFFKWAIEHGYPSDQIGNLPDLQKVRTDPLFRELFNSAE